MYNQLSFIAILQQAKKKPLVTQILLDPSYRRGWRCEYYYGPFLDFGQGTHLQFHRQIAYGEWRWSVQTPPPILISIVGPLPCTAVAACKRVVRVLRRGRHVTSSAWLFTGPSTRRNKQRRLGMSQFLALGFSFRITAYFAIYRVLAALLARNPSREGFDYPGAV